MVSSRLRSVPLDLPTSGRFNTSDQRGSTTQIITAERPPFDEARLVVAGFSGPTRLSYTGDLAVFAAKRGHLELWARRMEEAGLARAAIGRRLSTVAGFYRFAVINGPNRQLTCLALWIRNQ